MIACFLWEVSHFGHPYHGLVSFRRHLVSESLHASSFSFLTKDVDDSRVRKLTARLRDLLSMSDEGAASSSLTPLPTYEDLQAERALKGSFAQLLQDHEEIQRLFKSVAAQLETTPKIGEDHDLTREWNALFKVRSPGSCSVQRSSSVSRNTGGYIETRN